MSLQQSTKTYIYQERIGILSREEKVYGNISGRCCNSGENGEW